MICSFENGKCASKNESLAFGGKIRPFQNEKRERQNGEKNVGKFLIFQNISM